MKELRLKYCKESPYDGENISKFNSNFCYTSDDTQNSNNDGWEKWSLPLGNSYMGVNVFGRIQEERLQVTQNSLSNPYTHGNGGLNNFLEIYLKFDHNNTENFIRDLSLNNAIASVSYKNNGIDYKREYFTSYPDKVLVIRLTCSKKGNLSFKLSPKIPYICDYLFEKGDKMGKSGEIIVTEDTITAKGMMEYYQIKYEGQIKVIPENGIVTSSKKAISVKNADSATIILAVGTNYKMESRVFLENDPQQKLSPYEDPHNCVSTILKNASTKSYGELKNAHLCDYHNLFNRVSFNLTNDVPTIYTDELLQNYKDGIYNPYLEELYFQYGRYLLISSSRKGGYPANLQGTWNKYESAPWSSGYWHNINVQMNYWPSFNTNLVECFEPYSDYFQAYFKLAQKFADNYIKQVYPEKFSQKEGENGWTICTAAWLYTLLEDPPFPRHSGPGTGGFTSKLFWEYYDFTRNIDILKDITYPCLSSMSKFIAKVLEPYDDLLLTKYSASPEQVHNGKHYQTVGCAFDQQMIYENHSDTIKSAQILNINEPIVEIAKKQLPHLEPVIIGKSGQIKEYREEEFYGDIGEYHHRHISQLMGLYPGTTINSNTPEFLEAAKVTLNLRGDLSTGWSTAFKQNLWARTKDGNHTYALYQTLLKNCTMPNLWDLHPPFQIDGNFGGTAGVAEMLLQSHEGYIDIIPAIPDCWKNGDFNGLCARGAFEVSAKWEDLKLKNATILSTVGGMCKVKGKFFVLDENNTQVPTKYCDGITEFETKNMENYTLKQ